MPAPLGQQWVRLYRGLENVRPDSVDRSRLGVHWTPDPNIAHHFATARDTNGEYWWDFAGHNYPNPHGTVIEALIHRRHIYDPEDSDVGGAVFGRDHPEQEHTVRQGALVHIQKMHAFDDARNTYKRIIIPRNLQSRGRA